MNEQQLQELALQAQKQPLGTTGRRIALSKLIDAIYRSQKLIHPYKGQFQGIYEYIYQEALQDLFLYICTNIDKYNPERGKFITWINMLLSRRFFTEAIPKIIGQTNEINIDNSFLDNQENLMFENGENEDNYVSIFHNIRKYIETDPQGIFKEAYIKKYPQVNFQFIAIKRWSGISWKDISDELNIPIPTLSNFYQRTLEKFSGKFRDLFGCQDIS
ncbi:hypothetical protein [Mastigocoleus testarum]|uniref:Sigma-70 family RNA polymerase sigma factor n=1 Tax=Mastigocoleus testarum BC008 TaxID=371196 RepID=A0A0V7ZK65_9CYAN|nr:hypothetical protein [Mastigocoleus testarum]KST62210.1 hypothetical protein BC008_37850 [Mastigocoleus testarum BC008]KST64840.1 hypothetical protein BC008_18680 [Mastigocoleus testarum BC008]